MKYGLIIEGARQNNLKNVSLTIPHNQVTVITGLSGSGKSSLAFDTIFAEGQWRYIESLSAYARMFIEKISRPQVDAIRNVQPAIALEQRNPVKTSRSTIGTITELYDYLRLLYAKIARLACTKCGTEVKKRVPETVVDELLSNYPEKKAHVLFPVAVPEHAGDAFVSDLLRKGFGRIKQGDDIRELTPGAGLAGISAEVLVLLDRLTIKPEVRSRLADSVQTAFREGNGDTVIEIEGGTSIRYGQGLRCLTCGKTFGPPQPLLFSFNHPQGACPTCNGFGNVLQFDEDLIVPDKHLSLEQGAIEPWTKPAYRWWMKQLLSGAPASGIDVKNPYSELAASAKASLFKGTGHFYGIDDFFSELQKKRYKLHVRVFLSRYRSAFSCPACHGSRLKPEALQFTISGLNIVQVSAMPVEKLVSWFKDLSLSPREIQTAREVLRQIEMKLSFFLRVGLGYLTLDRQTRTLSGGEIQRVNLSHQLASRLTGTLYVLDEPSIGLHPRDTGRLAGIVRELAEAGNTVILVEHDQALIESADHVVEMGPGAGERGGRIVFEGPMNAFQKSSCLTARYLQGREHIAVPWRRRKQERKFLRITGAREHNLKNISTTIPLQSLTCVSGVSGSGKSTLVQDTLYRALARAFRMESEAVGIHDELSGLEHLKGVKLIDQQPIGKTPRSNPVTFIKAFDIIRKLFSELPDARMRRFTPGHFSFNVPGGRCPACEGNGFKKIEMYLFEDIFVRCDDCGGLRYKPEILKIRYKGHNIAQVLEMTVEQALTFFNHQASLNNKLRFLSDVGLGYLRLGQSATTLSGGESQRLKIARELGDDSVRDFLYILDEPTTGLHFDDIKKLLAVLNALVDAGNTVVVVEHNLDVLKTADWIIDLGPEGGDEGGRIMAEGTPEDVSRVQESYTGRYLLDYLATKNGEGR